VVIINPMDDYNSKEEEERNEERSAFADTQETVIRAYDYHSINNINHLPNHMGMRNFFRHLKIGFKS